MSLTQITEHVWVWPRHPDKNRVQGAVGVVIGRSQTVLIDAGNGPAHARRIRDALQAMGAPPVGRIIYTHHHWDHVFGAQVFDAPAVGHTLCRDLLLGMQRQGITAVEIRDKIEQNPDLIFAFTEQDWRDFRIVPPQTVFATRHELALEDVTLRLRHVGGVHAADSIVVQVVEDGVMFLGDCYYPAPVYANDPDRMIDFEMLGSFLETDCQYFIDGHKAMFRRVDVERIMRSQALVAQLSASRANR